MENPISADEIRQTKAVQDKICDLAQLAKVTDEAKAGGLKVVLAHGVFDLLHIGHIRHLEEAARAGDLLVVTITANTYVNKGPDRPVFTEQLRAEAIAALEYVDWVAINHGPSAENVVQLVQPNVYVKGVEYKDASEDVTGKIDDEARLVRSFGGEVLFTENVTYSSSSLINRYLDVFEPGLKTYLEGVRDGGLGNRLKALTDSVAEMNILMIGDAIIDEYRYVEPIGKSPKENMIATRYQDNEVFAGGVFAAANHVASFCKSVHIITSFGNDGYHDFARSSLHPNVKMDAIIRNNVPTTRKCRYIDIGYNVRKLFEVYHMDDAPLVGEDEARLCSLIASLGGQYDMVIVTDFGHGLIADNHIEALANHADFLAVNAQSNSANFGFNLITKYQRANYVCIDQPEARLAVADNHSDIEKIVSEDLPAQIDCPRIIVTRGKNGCLAYEAGRPLCAVPGFTSSIVDTVGAGDAFFAISAPFVRAGASIADAAFVGNAAGAMKVGIVGHRSPVERIPFQKFVTALLK